MRRKILVPPFQTPAPTAFFLFFIVFFPKHMLTAKQDNRLTAARAVIDRPGSAGSGDVAPTPSKV